MSLRGGTTKQTRSCAIEEIALRWLADRNEKLRKIHEAIYTSR